MMTGNNSANIAMTDSYRSAHPQPRQPANTQPAQAPARREEATPVQTPIPAQATGQVRSPDTTERIERLERMPEQEMQTLVNQANIILEPRNLELVYRRHEGTDRYFLTIYNRDTQEIAREIPPEWSLDMLARVWEMTGIFMNERG